MFNRKKKRRDKLAKAFGCLKDDSFGFEQIEKYFRKRDKSTAYHVLSDRTCNDLDFQEFFMYVDRTISKVGQQYLYDTLRCVPENTDRFAIWEAIIEALDRNPGQRLEFQCQLDKLAKSEAYYITSLFQDEYKKPPKWFFLIRLLSFASIISLILVPFYPQFVLVLLSIFVINSGIHYWNKRNLYQYLDSIPQLLRLNDVAKELSKYGLFKSIGEKVSGANKAIDSMRNKMLLLRLESKMDNDTQVIFWAIIELFKTMFLLEPMILFGVLKELDTKRKEVEEVFRFVGTIDTLVSIASLRKGLDFYCLPEVLNDTKSLSGEAIFHPLIPNCVANSIRTNSKSILLTGSNMSGKTSFIRAIGINSVSALTINTCFAHKLKLPKLKLYSAIRISDDLMNDKSYYFEEVMTVKEMLDKSKTDDHNLFLLDEIFKGTNTIERISAGKAVLSALNNEKSMVFVSTHDIELTDLLNEEYDLYHFEEQVNERNVDFDYKLKRGKMKNRNAIRILKINDYPEDLIDEAMELSSHFDNIIMTRDTEKR